MGAKSTLAGLSADLQKAAEQAVPSAKRITGQGCNNIKKDARRIIKAHSRKGYLPHYPLSITYEVNDHGLVVTGEVGPELGRLQAGLGSLLEHGSVNNAPIPHLGPALDNELPKFQRYVGEMGLKLLMGVMAEGGPVVDPGD